MPSRRLDPDRGWVRLGANVDPQTWKACWGQPLASSNLASSAILISQRGAEILRRLQKLLGGLGAQADPAGAQRVRGELDGLAALLESHFVYKEKRLVSALNSLSAPTWDGSRPDFLLTTTDAGADLGIQIEGSTGPNHD